MDSASTDFLNFFFPLAGKKKKKKGSPVFSIFLNTLFTDKIIGDQNILGKTGANFKLKSTIIVWALKCSYSGKIFNSTLPFSETDVKAEKPRQCWLWDCHESP